jgi:dATP pyrophosphohydrolase
VTETYRIPKSALIVVYNQALQVLVMQRNDDPNFWQSVTGTLEPGELPIQTAMREVQEETGIDITALGYQLVNCEQVNTYEIREMWRYRYPPDVTHNQEHVFCVQVNKDQPIKLTEHSAYLWLSKQDAMDKVWSETNRQAIEHYVPNR